MKMENSNSNSTGELFIVRQPDQKTMDNIIESFKTADKIQKRKLNLMYIILIISGLAFMISLSLTSVFSNFVLLAVSNIILVIMIIIAISLRSKYTEKNRIDYSLTTLELLKKAERSYRFWNSEWIFIVILILTCNLIVSTIFRFVPLSEAWSPLSLTIIAQSVYLPLLGIAFLFEWISWKKVRKQLREKTLGLIRDLES